MIIIIVVITTSHPNVVFAMVFTIYLLLCFRHDKGGGAARSQPQTEWRGLGKRIVICIRYGAQSLTGMIKVMSYEW